MMPSTPFSDIICCFILHVKKTSIQPPVAQQQLQSCGSANSTGSKMKRSLFSIGLCINVSTIL